MAVILNREEEASCSDGGERFSGSPAPACTLLPRVPLQPRQVGPETGCHLTAVGPAGACMGGHSTP